MHRLYGTSDFSLGECRAAKRFNQDGTQPLVREVVSRTQHGPERGRFIVRMFEVFARQGFSSAQIELFLSRDHGHTWTPGKPKPIGAPGRYDQRVIWKNLGQARQLTAKLRWSAPADVSISTNSEVTI